MNEIKMALYELEARRKKTTDLKKKYEILDVILKLRECLQLIKKLK